MMEKLLKKIKDKDAKIGIIGLGYVGLPLAIAFSQSFTVRGYDINKKIIKKLESGRSHLKDVKESTLIKYVKKTFFPTDNHIELGDCDVIIISVPTPLTLERDPDLTYVKEACNTIVKILEKEMLIILESTTYPGTTEEVVIPLLEKSGLKAGVDFGVAYSPERIDPGRQDIKIEQIPKVVGGISLECTEVASELYGSVFDRIIRVKDCKTAEGTKIIENIFREVNIALVNELALIFEKMGIDIWDAINAASTKPYGFMAFYPGPGVGGHCIPLDPHYLSYKAKKYGVIPRFIELSWEINEYMKIHTVNLISKGLKLKGKNIFESRVAVMGLAYKRDIDDTRETPSKKIIEELINLGARVKIYDPYVKSIKTSYGKFTSEKSLEDVIEGSDCVVFVTAHTKFKMELNKLKKILKKNVIVDCQNLFKNVKLEDVIYFGIGKENNVVL
jgi:UDP-N-acetyl-D-glucosamine dehydrogenase